MKHAACLFAVALSTGLLLTGCELLPWRGGGEEACTIPVVRITGVDVTPLDRRVAGGQTHFFHTDTLRTQLVFEVRALYDEVDRREVPCVDDPLIDPVPGEVLNPVELGPSALHFDRPIQVLGQEIPPGENVMQLDGLQDDHALRAHVYPFAVHEVRLDGARFYLPPGPYAIHFAWQTVAGEGLADVVQVYVDVP
jgi:hypothetical protein